MAHVRENCKNLSFSYSISENLFKEVRNHQFKRRFDYKKEALDDLVMKDLKYEALLEKKRERMLG